MNTQDKRYTAQHEFVTPETKACVLRFAGYVLTSYETMADAEAAAEIHETHGFNKSPWQLMTRLDSVMWLRDGKNHRIVYGADIRETKSDIQAAHWFGECVRHELECNGSLDQ